jgi:hypothetical protein
MRLTTFDFEPCDPSWNTLRSRNICGRLSRQPSDCQQVLRCRHREYSAFSRQIWVRQLDSLEGISLIIAFV